MIYSITSYLAVPSPCLHPHGVIKAALKDSVGCCWRRQQSSFWNALQTTAVSEALKKILPGLERSPLKYHIQFESNTLLRSPEENWLRV